MNKKTIVASLAEIANTLDINNLHKEASDITKVMVKVAQTDERITGNQVVYRVMRRMYGPDYNKMRNLNEIITKDYSKLVAAVTEEAIKLDVEPSEAIMRLEKASTGTSGSAMPIRNRQPGFGFGPSTVSPDQSTDKYDPAAQDYETHTKPMYDKAMQWINKNGGNGPSQAKKDAFDAKNAREISPQLYAVIEEILLPRIMKTPARPSVTGPFRRDK